MKEPNGLLCAGGDLSPARLQLAYSRGIFPWFSEREPILWWSPDPRLILEPKEFKFRRSLNKSIRKQNFDIRLNNRFEDIIRLCSETRRRQQGTWISEDMIQAYIHLNELGLAISCETYKNNQLVGGLYGVKLGRVLFGESMVSLVPDASKAALGMLCQNSDLYQIELIDCQVPTSHLESLGASLIPRIEFIERINKLIP